ncbi:hypothetical protein E1B28_005368 [Marasmius oreades]|uniref:Uncharacterized protein n=1 Tax=Marasmius oreades TaxID=181124 RepID=A0A9P7S3P5_9AGAR|nr:uncharacterized protein E1B28_005368 [Marasmius oreades]KAG7094540.1 hypothetical protein E1B28_005368 [Marasmius oreades]
MGARATRVTLYGIIIGLAICVNAIAVVIIDDLEEAIDAFTNFGIPLPGFGSGVRFGIVACVVGFLTWVWTSVLMAWNDKPYSEGGLALSLTHFISFIVMSLIWFAIAIMHFVETAVPCQGSTFEFDGDYVVYSSPSWCGETSVVGALSLVISILSGATALFILVSSRKVGGLQTKLVARDGEINLREMKHATRVRIALYCLILVFGLAINAMTPFATIVTIVATVEDIKVSNGADSK